MEWNNYIYIVSYNTLIVKAYRLRVKAERYITAHEADTIKKYWRITRLPIE